MFEVGFSEILMVALVALLVIGPEKMPKVARMAGYWVGKSRRILASVKQEIHEELQAEELRQSLKHKTGINDFQELVDDTAKDLYDLRSSVSHQFTPDSSSQQASKQDEQR